MNYMAVPGINYTLSGIITTVCNITGLPESDVKKRTRKREVVWSRQLCMALGKLKTKNSLQSVGDFYGDFDHCSVIHAIKTVKNLIDTDKKINKDVGYLFEGVEWPDYTNS